MCARLTGPRTRRQSQRPTEDYVERLGALTPYPSIETLNPIDTDKPVTITFTRTTGGTATTYTIPCRYFSIFKQFTDTTRTDVTQRANGRGSPF